jgi:hypothetical protein
MSIVKRKNVSGGTYYFNTTTKKFASEAAYKRSKGTGMGKIDSIFCLWPALKFANSPEYSAIKLLLALLGYSAL